jgi:predicted MFS family arabinose efflux permease
MTEQIMSTNKNIDSSPLKAVFRAPAFVTLWLSEGLSMVGDRMLMVALISLVYDRTGSAGAVGLLMVFKAVPALLLGSLAGVFVDRWNRKWIMVIANLLQGLLVFWFPFARDLAVICAIYFAMSAVNQFFVPARSSAIPDLVPESTLVAANSLFAMAIVFALAAGPALGTLVMDWLGRDAAFYLDSFSFLIPAAAVAFLTIPRQVRAEERFNLGSDLRAGLTFALKQPAVLAALTTITAAFFVVGTISVSGVVITREVLHTESAKFGYLMSGLGGGMVLGAVLSNLLKARLSGARAGLAGAALMGLAVLFLPLSRTLPAACLSAGFIGIGMIFVQINGQVLLQTIAPDMRGRLMGISQTLTGSASFLASAVTGLMLETINVTVVLWTVGFSTIIVTSAAALYFKSSHKRTELSK